MEDFEFSIIADSMEDADGNAYVTSLKIVSQGSINDVEGWVSNTENGAFTSNIANFKGTDLPSTGGMGTTIFYVTGGVIIASATIVLVLKRRKRI